MALLLNEVEEALAGLVKGLGVWPDVGVFTGQGVDTKKGPAVICEADGDNQEEDPKGTGNFWVNVRVKVKSTGLPDDEGSDRRREHVALADAVFSGLQVTDLDAQLNAQGRQLTVFPTAFIFSSPTRSTDESGLLIDELPIRLYCCASALDPMGAQPPAEPVVFGGIPVVDSVTGQVRLMTVVGGVVTLEDTTATTGALAIVMTDEATGQTKYLRVENGIITTDDQ